MAGLLKDLYDDHFIDSLSAVLQQSYTPFDAENFKSNIFDANWRAKELKQRMRHITVVLHRFLPENYQQALEVLIPVAEKFSGFEYMFFPDFVELYGLDDFATSMLALEKFTAYSSSEFAVRPFILRYQDKTMRQMTLWAEAGCEHVRRLASEGCRPRLPWAVSLPVFRENPQPVFKVLEKLKADDSEYVRRSVANNLNDISKDHPQQVIATADSWFGNNQHTDRLVKHACRSLLKQGHPRVLSLFGLTKPEHVQLQRFVVDGFVKIGEKLAFSLLLSSKLGCLGKLRIEYAIDFVRANGKQNRKLFKLGEGNYQAAVKKITRTHSFKLITTRAYYPGNHYLAIIVNGVEMGKKPFILQ